MPCGVQVGSLDEDLLLAHARTEPRVPEAGDPALVVHRVNALRLEIAAELGRLDLGLDDGQSDGLVAQ